MKDDVQKLRKMLQDLRDLRTTGFVDEEQYAENVERLERRLLDAVMNEGASAEASPAPSASATSASAPATPSPAGDAPHRPPRGAAWQLGLGAAAVVAVLLLVGGIAWWAASRAPAPSVLKAGDIAGLTAAERRGMTPDQLMASAEKLARRLALQPQDAEGWAALARLYAAAGRPPEAATAYEKAVALRGEDAALLVDYAEARAVVNNGDLSGEPTQLLMRALKIEPTQLQALSLAGTAAFDRRDYAMAVAYWEKITEIAPADDPRAAKARASLGEARQLARLPAAPASSAAAASPTATAAARAASSSSVMAPAASATVKPLTAAAPAAAASDAISGTITLAPSLASRASPGDTVFVYARAVDGPPFPLAVIRKQVKDLPLRFRLDDSMSMWPSAKVSGFPQVVVTARVSKSGEGQAQPGDLQGQSAPVAGGASGLRIEIGKVIGPK